MILLLTEGGTPFAAMQRYAPISDRVTFVRFTTSPSSEITKTNNKCVKKKILEKTV